MRISGTEPSSVILGQPKKHLFLESNVQKPSKGPSPIVVKDWSDTKIFAFLNPPTGYIYKCINIPIIC